MSRSHRALAETVVTSGAANGAGEWPRLEDQAGLGRRLLLGVVSATKHLVILLAASALVMALEPGQALASGAQAAAPVSQHNTAVNPAVLAVGSGFASGKDASQVRALQRRLAGAGYAPGPIDGRFGPLTAQALGAFQAAHALQVDGIAGPLTLAALRSPSAVLYPGAGYGGDGSPSVQALQRRLAAAGYSPGPIDGRYGPRTEQAVAGFQAAHGLSVDGTAGPQTFTELTKLGAAQQPVSRPNPPSRPVQSSRPTLPAHPKGTVPHKPLKTTAPQRTPSAPATGHGTSKPGSSSSPWFLVLLAALVLAALGTGAWFVERRRRRRLITAPRPAEEDSSKKPLIRPSAPVRPTKEEETGEIAALGARLEQQGHLDAAESAYRNADHRGDPVAASNLGVLLERRGDLAGAEDAYRRADARGDANGAFNLAGLLAERGEVEEAKAAYRRADERGDAGAAANLGALLEQEGDLVEAQAAYRRADTRGDGGAAANLGALLERHGDLAGAEDAYRRSDARGDANGAFNLGGLLAERGDLAAAAAAYHRADQRGDPAAASNLGVLLEQRGDVTGAADAYRRAEERGHATGAFNLGVLLEKLGDPIGALQAYARAEQLDQRDIAEVARARAHELNREVNGSTAGVNRGGVNEA